MVDNNTVLLQLLKLIPRHEMERLSNQHDGKRRSDALSRWSQFISLIVNGTAVIKNQKPNDPEDDFSVL